MSSASACACGRDGGQRRWSGSTERVAPNARWRDSGWSGSGLRRKAAMKRAYTVLRTDATRCDGIVDIIRSGSQQ